MRQYLRMMRCLSLIILAVAMLAGIHASGQTASNTVDSSRFYKMNSGEILKKYYFVMLKKGPKRNEEKDTTKINAIQKGHMDNMARMARLGKLNVAGPFDDDGDWRGIIIFDCNTEAEVKELLATDPAIKAGRLGYEIHPWWTAVGTVFK